MQARAVGSAAVYGLPLIAVLALGGTSPTAVIAALLMGAVGLVAGAAGRGERSAASVDVLTVGLGILLLWHVVTLVPLPGALLGGIAPANHAIVLAAAEAAGRAPGAAPISLAPGDSAVGGSRLALALVALLLANATVIRRGSPKRLVRAIGLASLGVVGVVLWHAVLPAAARAGLAPEAGRGPSLVLGPFVNSNDLAAFCCAVVPLAVVTAVSETGARRLAAALSAVVLAGVAMLTLSRSATLGLALGAGATVALLALGPKRRQWAGVLGVGLLSAGGLLAVASRLDPRAMLLVDGRGLVALDARLRVWSEAWDMAAAHWTTGVGARAFGSVWWSFRHAVQEVRSQDAEGTLPQLAATLGLPITGALLLLFLAVAALVLRQAVRSARAGDLVPVGAAAGLLALTAIASVTLTVSQPGIAVLGAYLLAVTGAVPVLTLPGKRRAVAGFGLVCVLSGVGLALRGAGSSLDVTDAWFASRLAADELGPGDAPLDVALLHPADPYGLAWSGVLLRRSDPERALMLVNRAMQLDPHGAEPHRAAVSVLLAIGRPDHARIEAQMALAAATRAELPRFMTDALERFPDDATRLRLLPADGDAATRVVRELGRQASPELALRAWIALAQRTPPVFEGVVQAVRLLPRGRAAEGVALAGAARVDSPGDRRLEIVEADALIAAGRWLEAAATLEPLLADPTALDDLWRSRALLLLGQQTARRNPADLPALLALPSQGGTSEEALRSWLRGEVLLADGQISGGLRELVRASQMRPDLGFIRERLHEVRRDASGTE